MSSFATTEFISPTEIVTKPLQQLEVKPAAQAKNFGLPTDTLIRPNSGVKVKRLDLFEIPMKDRLLSLNEWRTSDTGVIWTQEINVEFLNSKLTLTNQNFNLWDLKSLTFSIKTNINAFYQGLLWLVYEPSPFANWMKVVYGYDIHNSEISQLERMEIRPDTDGEYNFTIPMVFPFDFAPNTDSLATLPNTRRMFIDYARNYNFGRFYAKVIVPLETSSAGIALSYPLSFSLSGLTYGQTNLYLEEL